MSKRSEIVDGQKYCPGCDDYVGVANFSKATRQYSGLQTYCKDCNRKAKKLRSKEHNKAEWLRMRYGITTEEYQAMFDAQSGLCAVCSQPETRLLNRKDPTRIRALSVDHDHVTGKVRGLLCFKCNSALACVNDRPDILRMLIAYLDEHARDTIDECKIELAKVLGL